MYMHIVYIRRMLMRYVYAIDEWTHEQIDCDSAAIDYHWLGLTSCSLQLCIAPVQYYAFHPPTYLYSYTVCFFPHQCDVALGALSLTSYSIATPDKVRVCGHVGHLNCKPSLWLKVSSLMCARTVLYCMIG